MDGAAVVFVAELLVFVAEVLVFVAELELEGGLDFEDFEDVLVVLLGEEGFDVDEGLAVVVFDANVKLVIAAGSNGNWERYSLSED